MCDLQLATCVVSTIANCLVCGVLFWFRSLVGEVHNRIKASSSGAGSGDEQQTKNHIVTIHNDIKTLLSKAKVYTFNILLPLPLF